jgi:hypothetical protein
VITLRPDSRPATTALALAALVALHGCGGKPAEQPAATRAPLPAAADSLARAGNPGAGGAGDTLRGDRMPVIALGGRSADSIAMAPLTLALGAIGYRDGIVLAGSSAQMSVSIPVNDGLHPAELRLRVIPTPLMPPGTLVLRQRDRILAMHALTDTTTAITLPLGAAVVENGKANVQVALAVPGRELCVAGMFYRTVLLPESQVTFTGVPRVATEANAFFQPWVDRVTFYVAEQPSLDAAQAALDAAAFVARRYRGMATVFEIKPLPAPGTPLPEPGPWSRAVVWNPSGSTAVVQIDNGRGTVLGIAARRDARQMFTLADGADLVAAPGFRTSTVDLTYNTFSGGRVRTLAELGFEPRTIEGNSLISASYPISLADFGSATTPTSFRLIARHSVLPPNGNGSVRVHLNGDLIYSRALQYDGLDVVIPVPGHLLRRDNVLDVRFQVTLGEGACLVGGPVFTTTIDNSSAFVTSSGTTLPPGFARMPQSFVPAFSVLLDPLDRFRVELAATVIGAMQQTTRTPLAPALARDRAAATGPLLAVGSASLAEALDAPLKSAGVRLRDRSGKVWDEFAPDAPYGAMQGWQRGGDDVLLLHHTGTNGQPLADLVRESLAPYGWFGMRGDLAIRGLQGPVRTLTVANAGWRLEAQPAPEENLFARYKTGIFIAALVILAILLIWLYPRVVRRELDTTG